MNLKDISAEDILKALTDDKNFTEKWNDPTHRKLINSSKELNEKIEQYKEIIMISGKFDFIWQEYKETFINKDVYDWYISNYYTDLYANFSKKFLDENPHYKYHESEPIPLADIYKNGKINFLSRHIYSEEDFEKHKILKAFL
jgi:hypothetical protein